MLVKVASKDTETVVNALIKNARKLPQELYKSLTWDRGKEMAGHKRFTLATDIQVYFCDPHSPWQRGSNENTNGLLRQYLPKGIDISGYSQAKLNAVARQLNERPRKTLGYQTPAEIFSQTVAHRLNPRPGAATGWRRSIPAIAYDGWTPPSSTRLSSDEPADSPALRARVLASSGRTSGNRPDRDEATPRCDDLRRHGGKGKPVRGELPRGHAPGGPSSRTNGSNRLSVRRIFRRAGAYP